MSNLAIDNYNKFISLIARRFSKLDWHKLPERTKNVFHTYNNVDRWIVKATEREKMFFLEDLGFTTAITVFPNSKCNISDIEELSEYFFKIENRIKSVEKQLEKDMFCICTREIAVYFYNMSQNSNSNYFARQQDFKALQEANSTQGQKFNSATQYEESERMREGILKFCSNVITEFNNNLGDLFLEHKTILLNLREFNQTGVKPETIYKWFKGSVGMRQIQNYLAYLVKRGYVNRTGVKPNTIYILSSSGMLYINDYCDRIMQM